MTQDDRNEKQDKLIDEIFRILNGLLAWKNQTAGGLRVLVWGLGLVQTVVLACLGFAANSLNKTAETLGNHAVELATAKTKIDAYVLQPRFTAAENSVCDAKLKAELQEWLKHELEKRE